MPLNLLVTHQKPDRPKAKRQFNGYCFLLVVVFIAALQCSHLKLCDVQLAAQRQHGTALPRRGRRSQNSSGAVLIRCVLLQKVTLYFGTNQQNKSLSQELFKWFLATAPACAINLTNLGHHHWLKLPKNGATNSEEAMWLHSCVPCHTNSTGGFRTLLPTAWRITIPWFSFFFFFSFFYLRQN